MKQYLHDHTIYELSGAEAHSIFPLKWSSKVTSLPIPARSIVKSGNPHFFFIFYLVTLCLGCVPKISFIGCLEVPQNLCRGGGGLRANLVIDFGLDLA